jgi:hypothetical protein
MSTSVDALLATLRVNLDKVTQPLNNPIVFHLVQLLVILYGAFAAPALPLSVSKHFSNTWVRGGFLAIVLAVATRKPSLAVLLTTVYMMSLHFMTKSAVTQVAQFGVVTPETSIVISGGDGPSIKPQVVVIAEGQQMNQSVQEGAFNVPEGIVSAAQSSLSNAAPVSPTEKDAGLPHYDIEPEALFDNMGGAPVDLPTVPAGMPASDTGMSAPMVEGEVGIPMPYESAMQETLGEVAQ